MSGADSGSLADNANGGVARGLSPEDLRDMIARILDQEYETRQRELIEEHTREAMDEAIQVRVDGLIARERLLERQVNRLVGPRDHRLQEQQQLLERLARSLLGPQELLERAPAVINPDPATGPIARPVFGPDLAQADWSLPRIPPPGLDQPLQPD